ncbi:MAG: nucleoside recognition domain-containing protein [Clostridia bacterium]|nr:nucleoside recognition domain-containing protein [Clostridia bacterium]
MNKLWPVFIISSIIYAIIVGNVQNVNESIFSSAESAVSLTLTFLGTMCLWSGIIEIAKRTTLIQKITRFINPIVKKLFPNVGKKAYEEISMNIIANILGLGNAATPLGIRAMKTLQEENSDKDTLSDSMMMFILLNTASLQIIPTTVIAIRMSLNSQNPTQMIFAVWISTIMAAIVGIITCRIMIKKEKFK